MSLKLCFKKATRTTRRTVRTTSRSTSYQYTSLTIPPTVSTTLYTSSCLVATPSGSCSNQLVISSTSIPSRVITSEVPVATQTFYGYTTYDATYYTTSCYSGTSGATVPTDSSDSGTISFSQFRDTQSVSAGTIIGAVIGSVGGAVVIGILIYFFCKRKAQTKENDIQRWPVLSSQYTQPQGGQDTHLNQPYTAGIGAPYMHEQDGTPRTLPGNVPVQQGSFQYDYQDLGTGILNNQGPSDSLGQPSDVIEIVNQNSGTASNSEATGTGALLTPGATFPPSVLPIKESPSPPHSDGYSLPAFGHHHSASNPSISLLHEQRRLSPNQSTWI